VSSLRAGAPPAHNVAGDVESLVPILVAHRRPHSPEEIALGKIQQVSWADIRSWQQEVAGEFSFDGIVGISRSGAVLAIGLSYLCPTAPLHFVYKSATTRTSQPFYVFGAGREERLRETMSSLRVTDGFDCKRPLVVDDVATFWRYPLGDRQAAQEIWCAPKHILFVRG
jgi:hypothetical protein